MANNQGKKYYTTNSLTMVCTVLTEPEFKYTPQGIAVLSFSTTFQNGDEAKTFWCKVSIWRERAEALSQYLKKGQQVTVIGKLDSLNLFTSKKTGETSASLQITAMDIALPRKGEEGAAASTGNKKPLPQEDITEQEGGEQVEDEKYPF